MDEKFTIITDYFSARVKFHIIKNPKNNEM